MADYECCLIVKTYFNVIARSLLCFITLVPWNFQCLNNNNTVDGSLSWYCAVNFADLSTLEPANFLLSIVHHFMCCVSIMDVVYVWII